MNRKDLIKYLSFFAMGDGGVYYSGNNCRMVTNCSSDHEDYILWKKEIMENLTEVNLHTAKQDGRKDQLVLTSRTHPIYTAIRNRIYTGNYRGIDSHYLKLLDWETLGILYMDDGSMYIDARCKSPTPDVRLNTKRLSEGDSWMLKKFLKDRMDLEFNVNRHHDRYFLRLRAKDVNKFMDNIIVAESFSYKTVRTNSTTAVVDDIV